jgi:hypothetical protein
MRLAGNSLSRAQKKVSSALIKQCLAALKRTFFQDSTSKITRMFKYVKLAASFYD